MRERDLIAEAITDWFGARCPDYDRDCKCCRAWRQYDRLRHRPTPSPEDRAENRT